MADSLPVLPFGIALFSDNHEPDDDDCVPDDLPVLPDDVLLIIAREYRLATAEDRAMNGWHRVHLEMRYLPRCPKRKRLINLKGFYVPRHGNQLEPVSGYFYRRLIRKVFALDAEPRLYRWFTRVFGCNDYLRPGQACEWPTRSVATRSTMRRGSTSVNSGLTARRCVAWRMSGPNATG